MGADIFGGRLDFTSCHLESHKSWLLDRVSTLPAMLFWGKMEKSPYEEYILIARTQICENQAPGNRAFNGEFTFQQPAQILPRNSRELEKAVAENTNLNFMAETCHPGRCSRRSF